MSDALDLSLRKAAPVRRYQLRPDQSLVPDGCLLPEGKLPGGPWLPLAALVEVAPQTAALAGQVMERAALRIVPGGAASEANVLLAALSDWADYADGAPTVRLRPLRFAAGAAHAIIRGTPLPPIPGLHFVEKEGIAVPCGHTWSPALDAASMRALLRLDADDLALFVADGSWQHVPAAAFIAASRSAVRLSVSSMGGAP